MRRLSIFRHENWDEGLNLVDRPTDLVPGEGTLFKNCYGLPGSLHKRPGYAKYNSVTLGANPIHSMFRFYKRDGTKKFVVSYNGTLKVGDDALGTFADLATGLNATAKFSFEAWSQGNFLIATNLTDVPQKWDGVAASTSALAGSPPKAKFVKEHENRVVLLHLENAPNDLQISSNANGEDWTIPATLDPTKGIRLSVPSTKGEGITGSAKAFGNLAIFQDYGIHVLMGKDPANFALRETDATAGCMAPRSIVETIHGPIYLSRDGVYRFNGSVSVSLSRKLASLFKPGHALSLNLSKLEGAEAGVYRNWYLLSVPEGSSSTNNKTYMLDLNTLGRDNPSWYGPWDIAAGSFAPWNGGTDQGELYFGDPVNGFAYRITPDIYTDVAAAIAMEYESSDFDKNLPEKRKRERTVQAIAKANGNWDVDVQVSIDGAAYVSVGAVSLNAGSLWGILLWGGTWGSVGTITSSKLVIGRSGRRIRYKLLHSGVNQPVDIDDVVFEFKLEKR